MAEHARPIFQTGRAMKQKPAAAQDKTLTLALQHHQAGRLAEAEALYHSLLKKQPRHADALHFLGVIAYQRGDHRQSVALIEQALGIRKVDSYYTNLALPLKQLGRLSDAATAYRAALHLRPANADGWN